MTPSRTTRYRRVAIVTSAALLSSVPILLGSRPAGGVIRACVHDSNGHIAIVSDTRKCMPNSHLLEWNREGLAGPPGP
jgi:hypothetical protein